MKSRVKKACTFISNFEDTLIREAKEKQLDGVVCGHIHHPAHVDEDGFTYLNCGDWIENCTAVVESETGHLFVARHRFGPQNRRRAFGRRTVAVRAITDTLPLPLPEPAAEITVDFDTRMTNPN